MTYCHTDVSHFEIQHAPKNSSLLAQLVERSAFKRICLSKDTEMSGVRAPYEEFFIFVSNYSGTILFFSFFPHYKTSLSIPFKH